MVLLLGLIFGLLALHRIASFQLALDVCDDQFKFIYGSVTFDVVTSCADDRHVVSGVTSIVVDAIERRAAILARSFWSRVVQFYVAADTTLRRRLEYTKERLIECDRSGSGSFVFRNSRPVSARLCGFEHVLDPVFRYGKTIGSPLFKASPEFWSSSFLQLSFSVLCVVFLVILSVVGFDFFRVFCLPGFYIGKFSCFDLLLVTVMVFSGSLIAARSTKRVESVCTNLIWRERTIPAALGATACTITVVPFNRIPLRHEKQCTTPNHRTQEVIRASLCSF
mgnify:CR=1 FL=1